MAQASIQINEIERLIDQLKRAFEGDAWHGPALLEILSGVDAKTAAAKPIPAAHSIWEIVEHVGAWDDAVRRRLGGQALQLTDEQDWPAVKDTSAATWRNAVDSLKQRHNELLKALAELPDYRLLATVPGKDYDYYHMLQGVVQHELYHAGQMAILKKAQI